MSKIGHASIDERGKIKGGVAGDQTGREVCIRNWYNKPWHTVLRVRNAEIGEKMAKACEFLCRCDLIGYDQNERNSLRRELVKINWNLLALKTPCEADCSSFQSVLAEYGGVVMYPQYTNGNAPTTANMVNKFYATGMFDVLTNSAYLKTDTHLKRSDILVGSGHTAMCLEDGKIQYVRPVLSRGSKGSGVLELQRLLNRKGYHLTEDSDFGRLTEQAVISFQGSCNDARVVKDGVVGEITYSKLI